MRALIVCLLLSVAVFGQVPEHPQPQAAALKVVQSGTGWSGQRPLWDYKAAWGAWAISMTMDGIVSDQWAGRGSQPCAWEGNTSFARKDGTFRTGKYFTENALIGGGLFAINLVIRKKAPVKIANHWAVRALGDGYPIYRTQEHTRNVIAWVHRCRG